MSYQKDNLQQKLCKDTYTMPEVIVKNDVAEASINNNIIPFKKEESGEILSLVPEFAITINEARERIQLLQRFVRELMIEGVDYGIVSGSNKPSLYKSGAEKLTDVFGLSKRIDVINRFEDWNKGIFHYEVKATLINKKTGLIESEGVGSCNSLEKKYKSQDGFTIGNTIIKMAKKRALVDAVLSATRASGLFTQDMEDIMNTGTSKTKSNTNNDKSNNNTKLTGTTSDNDKDNLAIPTTIDYPVTKSQLNELFQLRAKLEISIPDIQYILLEMYQVHRSKDLNYSQAQDLLTHLKTSLNAIEAANKE